jgi:hypothetical protein
MLRLRIRCIAHVLVTVSDDDWIAGGPMSLDKRWVWRDQAQKLFLADA